MAEIVLDGESLTSAAVEAVAREGVSVAIEPKAREAIRTARDRIDAIVENKEPVYGVNTGFGELVNKRIPPEELESLQRNLLRSHAAGSGPNLSKESVRAMMVVRINTLVKGLSGVREVVVDHLVTLLNEGVHPVVPSRGSLGASGDLAPLAHMSLVLIGEGEAIVDGEPVTGETALQSVGLDTLNLQAKEGLALINGTQLTAGIGALVVRDAIELVAVADVTGALTTEVTMSSTVPSHPQISAVRPHPGQVETARNIRELTAGSEIVESHRNCDRVQDAYSLRCLPQVHGAVRETVTHVQEALEIELNSATDNPLVFSKDDIDDEESGPEGAAILSGGNFHGEVLALRLDYLVSALTELAAIAERRIDRMLNPNVQEDHLPPFLTEHSGVMSGYMIAQYAAAALVNECRATGRPSMDNTPVSGNQEDHVSMSAQACLEARKVLKNARKVVATELLCAAQAAEFVGELAPGDGTGVAYEAVRERIPRLEADRQVHKDVTAIEELITSGTLLDRVRSEIGDNFV